MIRASVHGLIAAALVAAAGCGGGTSGLPAPASGLAGRVLADPVAAADALEATAPAPGEEWLRLRLLADALEGAGASPERWSRLLEAAPAGALRSRARLGLARALLARGRREEAAAVLRTAMEEGDAAAALELAEIVPEAGRDGVLRWLAVHDPAALRGLGRRIERRVVETLPAGERIRRADRLVRAGRPRQALAELRSGRYPKRLAASRRLAMARAALAARRPGETLQTLGRLPGPAAALLRARAWRARGWGRYPGPGAGRAFDRALADARQAVPGEAEREGALEIVLECATETSRLAEAWEAWRRLAAAGWHGKRREWLGRRLGVALALSRASGPVRALEAELPAHRRCLAYWLARSTNDRTALRRLAAGPVADLYAVWAARRLGLPPPRFETLPPLGASSPPAAVGRWLAAGRRDLAREVWWWRAGVRGLEPREALALAAMEAERRPDRAVRAIRLAFPAVREGRLDRVPRDALELYLPLRWRRELEAAARAASLPPWLLAGQVRQESLWIASARSPRGARGLLQLLPGTARELARSLGLTVTNLEDPAMNLRLGAMELARLRGNLGSLELALAAYNGGPARIRRWSRLHGDPERLVEAIPVLETYGYVRRVIFLAAGYRALGPWKASGRDVPRTATVPDRVGSVADPPGAG